MDYDWCYK
jgi:hypothetical protein